MHCPKCQHNNPEEARFCNDCGHSLSVSPETITSIDFNRPHSYTPRFLVDKILTAILTWGGNSPMVFERNGSGEGCGWIVTDIGRS